MALLSEESIPWMPMARRPISSLTVLDLKPEPVLLRPRFLPYTRGHRKDHVKGADRQSPQLGAALGEPARSSGLARGKPNGLGRAQAHLLLFKIKTTVDLGKAGPRPPVATGHSAKQAWRQMPRHPGARCQDNPPSAGQHHRCQQGWAGPASSQLPLFRALISLETIPHEFGKWTHSPREHGHFSKAGPRRVSVKEGETDRQQFDFGDFWKVTSL